MKLLRFLFFVVLSLFAAYGYASDLDKAQRLLQMLDYIGVDYPPTVENGKVIDPIEYEEMQEFSTEVQNLILGLPETTGKKELQQKGSQIKRYIEDRQEGSYVTDATAELKLLLIDAYELIVAPKVIPDVANIQPVYDANCTSCHGAFGYGDGPLSKGLVPAPSNFHDESRQYTRSVYDLYNTITLGVPGTPMQSYASLSEEHRWALAFLVGQFVTDDAQTQKGKSLWQQGELNNSFQSLSDITEATFKLAAETAKHKGIEEADGIAILAYLRDDPSVLDVSGNEAIDTSIEKILISVDMMRKGNRKAAHDEALSAYLDGFELTEANLVITNKILKSQIEKEMLTFRQLVKSSDLAEVEKQRDVVLALLTQAKNELNEATISPTAAFVGSFVILLREGLEAILVLAAILAALIKTGRRDGLKFIHIGWVGALLLGLFTWWMAENLIDISGASREITEGMAALCAAVILIYVGFWLHNASHSKRWKQFVEHKIDNAMEGSTLWALALVSFIAVYREIFETILFYQAMWVQLEPSSYNGFIFGIVSGFVLLIVLAVLIFKVGTKLPIKMFFQVNAVLLFMLAVIFSGQGIAALQEAGMVAISTIDFPTIGYLGVYPTTQGLGLQLFVLILGISLLIYQKKA